MKNLIYILLLYFLIINVNAIQDSYIFLDNKNLDICLSIDNLNNFICNTTEYLTIEGTQDHNLYFIPSTEIKNNDTYIKQLRYFALEPFYFIIAISVLIMALFVMIILCMFFIKLAGINRE